MRRRWASQREEGRGEGRQEKRRPPHLGTRGLVRCGHAAHLSLVECENLRSRFKGPRLFIAAQEILCQVILYMYRTYSLGPQLTALGVRIVRSGENRVGACRGAAARCCHGVELGARCRLFGASRYAGVGKCSGSSSSSSSSSCSTASKLSHRCIHVRLIFCRHRIGSDRCTVCLAKVGISHRSKRTCHHLH